MRLLKFTASFFFTVIIICSCKKDSFITSPQALLGLSADSLTFDTVFTSVGSITKSFKIFNLNNQKLQLSKVRVLGGASSSFKINVDGTAATEANNIDIEANDSIYVFVQVNIDPNAGNLPFIISDSILINYNGNDEFVKLQAYGQNAIFLNSRRVSGNVSFTKDLPYVILGGLLVDSTAILTFEPGTKIYLHADAPIIVDGTLIVNGTKQENVIFNGDRLDPDYKDLPASWPGIYFRENSQNSTLQFTVIKNAYRGLIALGLSTSAFPKLKISQCIIDNIYDAGILGINTTIYADNSLISNCGSNVLLAYGGNYMFTHCTVASYGNIFTQHKDPVLQVYNFVKQDNQIITADLTAGFTNCIFWGDGGNVEDEVVAKKEGTTKFEVTFDRVLYKALNDPVNVLFNQSIKNQDPLFDSVNTSKFQFDFHFNHLNSPAIDNGIATPFPKDLDDRPRINGLLPDIGCYEK
ncbi:MAG: hypothetical protein ABJA71_04205 [Ginsengibacter sp.]